MAESFEEAAIHIDTRGDGTDVVFLHGLPQFPGDSTAWASALASSFRTHVVHLPGYGRSPAAPSPYDWDGVCAELASDLRDGGVERCVVVGSSGGFYRGLQLASMDEGPEVVGLVGLGPVATFDEEARAGLRAFAQALRDGVDLSAVAVQQLLSPEFAAAHPDAAAHAAASLRAAPPEAMAAEFESLADMPDLAGAITGPTCPVVLRVGEHDAAAPLSVVSALGATLGADVQVVAGAGHLLALEDSDGTLQALRGALRAMVR
ncbi:MAG: alpha/beta hydrolase [Alphaproteobacteria bacterium]|nr:alpha/beta hydrolase [Alphaproteobacteria bacterium]MCB9695376.1 alpha/beta hydrolase [Alphaproteobacteria bacterium]